MMITISALIQYPIKACRGVEINSTAVERMGFEHDRRMMVITPEGRFLTQRDQPKLALVKPELSIESLILTAPCMRELRVEVQKQGKTLDVLIWKSRGVKSVDQGEQAAQWFSEWLGLPARLVHLAEGYRRKLNPAFSVFPDDHTGFADGYPILLTTEESLTELNSRLAAPIPMNRFRPNLVVKGCRPFEEDEWKRIKAGCLELAIVKPCPRCMVTTIDKETLETGREPLKTLSIFRKQPGGVMFGQNAIPLNEGRLEVGMSLQITKR